VGDHASTLGSGGSAMDIVAASAPNRSTWPEARDFCERWPLSIAASIAANICARFLLLVSNAPDLMRLSSTRLLTALASTTSVESKSERNTPPHERASTMHDTADRPMPWIAASPHRKVFSR